MLVFKVNVPEPPPFEFKLTGPDAESAPPINEVLLLIVKVPNTCGGPTNCSVKPPDLPISRLLKFPEKVTKLPA